MGECRGTFDDAHDLIIGVVFYRDALSLLQGWERIGGADGIRTHDLLDAIEARFQLRHGPTAGMPSFIAPQARSVKPGLAHCFWGHIARK